MLTELLIQLGQVYHKAVTFFLHDPAHWDQVGRHKYLHRVSIRLYITVGPTGKLSAKFEVLTGEKLVWPGISDPNLTLIILY